MATRATFKIYSLKPDLDYAIQLAAVVNGIEGPKSARFQFRTSVDNVAPGPVRNLKLRYIDGLLVLSWDPPASNEDGSPLTDLYYYYVRVTDNTDGTESVLDTSETQVEFTLRFLKYFFEGKLSGAYSFEVSAVDKNDNEGEGRTVKYSAEPPAPFNMLNWVAGNQSITVSWEESVDVDLTHYEVYRDNVLAGRTIDTETEFTDGNPGSGTHSYYAIAYDAFGLFTRSTNTLTGARAYGYWQGDSSTPRAPTKPLFVSTVTSPDGALSDIRGSFSAPTKNTDGTDYEDHNEFMIQWSKLLTGPWQTMRVPDTRVSGSTEASFNFVLNELASGTEYHFRISAIDRYSNQSAWLLSSKTTTYDTKPPAQPAAPIAAGGLLRVQVQHDLTTQAGGLLEEDVKEFKVYAGPTADFDLKQLYLIGNLSTLRPKTGFRPIDSFPIKDVRNVFIKVVAVDTSGNESVGSLAADSGKIDLVSDAYIENASITNASIKNLSAAKLITNSAFINDLRIQSTLTVMNGGLLRSDNYQYKVSGWRLSEEGLEINNGTVAASALTISSSPNLIPWAYSSFEHDNLWFFGGKDSAGFPVPAHIGRSIRAAPSSIWVDGWEGERSLAFRSNADTGPTAAAGIFFTENTKTDFNIDVTPGQRFVYSMYIKTNTPADFALYMYWKNSVTTATSQPMTLPSTGGQWKRIYGVFKVPVGATDAFAAVITRQAGIVVLVDAVQVELATSPAADDLLEPSAWKSPTQTFIDGGMIRTGEIKSVNYDVGNTGWRIGLEGNASFNNIFARGTIQAVSGYLQNMFVYKNLFVGNAANDATSQVRSYNGKWSLRGDGFFRAVDADITGRIMATEGDFSNVRAYSMNVGFGDTNFGYIKSSNYNGGLSGGSYGTKGWMIRNAQSAKYSAVFHSAYIRGNLSADDITTGYLKGDFISGGEIRGVIIRTERSPSDGYVRIGKLATNGKSYGSLYFVDAYENEVSLRGIFYSNLRGWGAQPRTGITTTSLAVGNLHISGNMYSDTPLQAPSFIGGSASVGVLKMNAGKILNSSVIEASQLNIQYSSYSSTTVGQLRNSGSNLFLSDAGSGKSGLLFDGSTVKVISNSGNSTTYRPIYASAFTVNSSAWDKSEIEPLPAAMSKLQQLQVFKYNHANIPDVDRSYGFIAEQLYEVDPVLAPTRTSVDLYGVLALTVQGVQELAARVQALEAA